MTIIIQCGLRKVGFPINIHGESVGYLLNGTGIKIKVKYSYRFRLIQSLF